MSWSTKGNLLVQADYRHKRSLFHAIYGAWTVKVSHCVTMKSDEFLWCLKVLWEIRRYFLYLDFVCDRIVFQYVKTW